MTLGTILVYLPLTALLTGAAAGLLAGRFSPRGKLWLLPGALSAIALALIVQLALVQPGSEEAAFVPLVWLTGGVLPALFAVSMGALVGRALSGRPAF